MAASSLSSVVLCSSLFCWAVCFLLKLVFQEHGARKACMGVCLDHSLSALSNIFNLDIFLDPHLSFLRNIAVEGHFSLYWLKWQPWRYHFIWAFLQCCFLPVTHYGCRKFALEWIITESDGCQVTTIIHGYSNDETEFLTSGDSGLAGSPYSRRGVNVRSGPSYAGSTWLYFGVVWNSFDCTVGGSSMAQAGEVTKWSRVPNNSLVGRIYSRNNATGCDWWCCWMKRLKRNSWHMDYYFFIYHSGFADWQILILLVYCIAHMIEISEFRSFAYCS